MIIDQKPVVVEEREIKQPKMRPSLAPEKPPFSEWSPLALLLNAIGVSLFCWAMSKYR